MKAYSFLPGAYRETLSYLANKFFNNDAALKSASSNRKIREFLELMQWQKDHFSNLPPWEVWAQRLFRLVKAWNQEHRLRKFDRLSREEYFFILAVGQHVDAGLTSVSVPWPVAAHISGLEIDTKVPLSCVKDGITERALWIELLGDAPSDKPWISKAIGVLVLRSVACDAPPEWNRQMQKEYNKIQDASMSLLFRGTLHEMLSEGIPCEIYDAYVVQRSHRDLRFVPLRIGHEAQASTLDALSLSQEVAQAEDKYKETKYVWANTLLRILLTRSCLPAVGDTKPNVINEVDLQHLDQKTGLFFMRSSAEGKTLCLRKRNQLVNPFLVQKI